MLYIFVYTSRINTYFSYCTFRIQEVSLRVEKYPKLMAIIKWKISLMPAIISILICEFTRSLSPYHPIELQNRCQIITYNLQILISSLIF